jgi:hypothetical protein
MECDPTPGRLQAKDRDDGSGHRLALSFDTFAWEALTVQSTALGVTIEELVSFSVLYYIADLDSKRIARRLPPGARSSTRSD